MKYIFCLALSAGFFNGLNGAPASGMFAKDSVGVEKVGGKIFVLHRINQGQTMFAVVRQYGTTIHALREANPGMSDQVQSGQTIRVPYTVKASKRDLRKAEIKAEVKQNKPAETPPPVAVTSPLPPAHNDRPKRSISSFSGSQWRTQG